MRFEDTDRTRRLAATAGSWILPHWMERQLDPSGAWWEPDPGAGPLRNAAVRDVVPVGTVGAPEVATVDPRGLVTPWADGWSLDWWVGADDRWHIPSREVAVRQSLLDDAPVVETSMRVPGGDVVERVWAFSDPGFGPVLAIELENAGRVPVAIALAVRPYNTVGAVQIGEVAVDASGVMVDGRRALWLPKEAARVQVSTWADGDVADAVLAGEAGFGPDGATVCREGMAQAAVVLPLAHGTSVVVLVPLAPASIDPSAGAPTVVPPSDAVARGWASHRTRAARVEVPDAELAGALAAATCQVMLAGAGARLDRPGAREVAAVTRALDRLGLHDEVDPIVASLPEGQGPGARLGGDDPDPAATGAVLVAASTHWLLGRDAALVDAVAGPLAAGSHHRPRAGRFVRTRQAPLDPVSAAWQLAGARGAADALAAARQPDASDAVRGSLADLRAMVGDGGPGGASGPDADRPVDDPVALLDLLTLGVVAVDSPAADALLSRIRRAHVVGAAVLAPEGLSPERTAQLAGIELRRGEPAALDRLRWLVESGGPERAWPSAVHPRTGTGCGGHGWSASAAAAVVDLALDLLVCTPDPEAAELRLLPVLPVEWLGAGIEAHQVPTHVGLVSFAVRWHGERPALLWEVVPHEGVDGVRLTIPGLDPSWSTTDLKGDALLAPPVVPPTGGADGTVAATQDDPPGPGPSFG